MGTGLGSGWSNSAWDCSTASPHWEPSPWIFLIMISSDLSLRSSCKGESCERAGRVIPAAVVFQWHAVSPDHQSWLQPRQRRQNRAFHILVNQLSVCLWLVCSFISAAFSHRPGVRPVLWHSLTSFVLMAESSWGDFQHFSEIARKGLFTPTNKWALRSCYLTSVRA